MPAKPVFSKAQLEVLYDSAKKVRRKFKTQQEAALALGLTQPSFSALLKRKWNPGQSTASAIAEALGVTLEDLIGPYEKSTMIRGAGEADMFPNLDVCIKFYAAKKKWSPWTIAAARAGFFGDIDFAAPDWEKRLDELEFSLSKVRKASVSS